MDEVKIIIGGCFAFLIFMTLVGVPVWYSIVDLWNGRPPWDSIPDYWLFVSFMGGIVFALMTLTAWGSAKPLLILVFGTISYLLFGLWATVAQYIEKQ